MRRYRAGLRRSTSTSSPRPGRAPRWCASNYPRIGARAARRRARRRPRRRPRPGRAEDVRADRVPGRRARRDRRRRVLPAHRHLPPDLPRPARCSAWATGRARLLEAVKGLELRRAARARTSAAASAAPSRSRTRTSRRPWARDKVGNVAATGAEVLCAADNSCLMHIGGIAAPRRASAAAAVHLAEILAATEERARVR